MAKKHSLTTFIGGIIDKMSYGKIAMLIVGVLLFCATFFWIFNPYGNGTDKQDLDWFNALYYSIITFSSLGYGDISPVGYGKIVASIEVFLGLLLTAILIGKIASERQYAMLRLVYTSTHQRRLVELKKEIDDLRKELDIALTEHNHKKIYSLSQSIYRFIAGLGNYLYFQADQGDLASFGNNSAFRRLYTSTSKLQLIIYEALRTYGIQPKSKKNFEQILTRINLTVTSMIGFHNKDKKINSLLSEILQMKINVDKWNKQLKEGKAKYKYRSDTTEYLMNKIKEKIPKSKWERDIHKKIAKELGIQNKLAEKCIDKLFKDGSLDYYKKTSSQQKI